MTTDVPPPEPVSGDPTEAQSPPVDTVLLVLVALAVAAGTVLRFWPRSALWLDEALTVNISSLSWGEIGDALRQDGHPPLFYYLLHVWTAVGGTSDWWVRALAGVISLASFPLAYLAGRRVAERRNAGPLGVRRTGLLALALAAMLPYGIRYGAETRMYSLAITLVFAGYLLVDDLWTARSSGTRRTVVAVGTALVTAALLWSHYWSMWLLAVVGLVALYLAVRATDDLRRSGARFSVAALVVGGLLFLPWVPTLLYQSAHTGTPWGKAYGPVEVVTTTIQDFSGDALTSYVAIALVLLALSALVMRAGGEQWVVLTSSLQPRVRAEIGILVATIGIGWATAAVSGNTYSSRYGAVVYPLFVLSVAAGVAVIRHRTATAVAVAVLVVLSGYVAVGQMLEDRTQAGDIGARIIELTESSTSDGPSVVVACPDQIGVAVQRVLDQADTGIEVIPYPTAGDPRFVDWVDYSERNEAADPMEFAALLAQRVPADATVHVVAMPGYTTFGSQCEQLVNILGAGRTQIEVVGANETGEGMGMWVFGPSA